METQEMQAASCWISVMEKFCFVFVLELLLLTSTTRKKEKKQISKALFSLRFTFLFLDRNLPREYNTNNREKPEYMQMLLVPKRVFEVSTVNEHSTVF